MSESMPRPSRSSTPVRKFSTSTSARSTSPSSTSRSASSRRSRVTDSLLRLAERKYVDSRSPCGGSTKGGPQPRVSSPVPGASTLTTRAPRSPSIIVACGPARARVRSTTRSPSSGPRVGSVMPPPCHPSPWLGSGPCLGRPRPRAGGAEVDVSYVLAVLAAGFGAGLVLTAVGAGSLVSFPILLGVGLSPLVANVCNNVGMVPGGVTGAYGFRRELAGYRHLVLRVMATSMAGALVGAVFLLALPAGVFDRVVPFLVLLSATLVGLGPAISRAVRSRATRRGVVLATDREH